MSRLVVVPHASPCAMFVAPCQLVRMRRAVPCSRPLRPCATAAPRRRTRQPRREAGKAASRTSVPRAGISPPETEPSASARQPYSASQPPRRRFELVSPHLPAGDQPAAIAALARLMRSGRPYTTLRGVTGSGKTLMVAHTIAALQRPALVLAPNKTLAAQLCSELSALFPRNRVEFFVSHFAFFQPEAYLPGSDKYIAKMSAVDARIDRLRHAATRSLFEREDTIVVASVSAIYGLGLPTEYLNAALRLRVGEHVDTARLAARLREVGYESATSQRVARVRGLFHVSDASVRLSAPWEPEGTVYRIGIDKGRIAALSISRSGEESGEHVEQAGAASGKHVPQDHESVIEDEDDELVVYPARHFVLPRDRLEAVIAAIEDESSNRAAEFRALGKHAEAERLGERVSTDMALLRDVGFCAGMENYTRHLSGRAAGAPPQTLLDYMPAGGDWVLVVDESHVTVPQLGAMHSGNAARKSALIEHGFRLPSAADNRPLSAREFWDVPKQTLFVSATPGAEELRRSGGAAVVEAVIRPTGIADPTVDIVPTRGQVDDLAQRLASVAARGGKAIVTTVTKRFAEDLAACLASRPPVRGVLDRGLRVTFLHSGIDSVGRMHVLEAMRGSMRGGRGAKSGSSETETREETGDTELEQLDVVVGVNLLREGIDLPAVELVAIMDADAQGFLRGETALIQTIGRAARNVRGHVLMYADGVSCAMERAIVETRRRRRLQLAHNRLHGRSAVPVNGGNGTAGGEEKGEGPDAVADGDGDGLALLERIREQSRRNGDSMRQRRFTTGLDDTEFGVGRWKRQVEADRSLEQLLVNGSDAKEMRVRMLAAADVLDFETAALLRDRLDELGEP